MEMTASGGVDRTVLRLSYEGHQPDIEAMRLLYDNPDAIIFKESTQEDGYGTQENGGSTQENRGGTQENRGGTQENRGGTQESKGESSPKNDKSTIESSPKSEGKGESTIENHKSTIESAIESSPKSGSKGESTIENPKSGVEKDEGNIEGLIDSMCNSIEFKQSSTEQKILNLLKIDGNLTLDKISLLTKMSRKGIQKAMDRLKVDNRLIREGSTKAGRWVVKE